MSMTSTVSTHPYFAPPRLIQSIKYETWQGTTSMRIYYDDGGMEEHGVGSTTNCTSLTMGEPAREPGVALKESTQMATKVPQIKLKVAPMSGAADYKPRDFKVTEFESVGINVKGVTTVILTTGEALLVQGDMHSEVYTKLEPHGKLEDLDEEDWPTSCSDWTTFYAFTPSAKYKKAIKEGNGDGGRKPAKPNGGGGGVLAKPLTEQGMLLLGAIGNGVAPVVVNQIDEYALDMLRIMARDSPKVQELLADPGTRELLKNGAVVFLHTLCESFPQYIPGAPNIAKACRLQIQHTAGQTAIPLLAMFAPMLMHIAKIGESLPEPGQLTSGNPADVIAEAMKVHAAVQQKEAVPA